VTVTSDCDTPLQIDSIHWLDSGNGSLEGAMPTEELALSVLSRYE
jgi:hypothetical protein